MGVWDDDDDEDRVLVFCAILDACAVDFVTTSGSDLRPAVSFCELSERRFAGVFPESCRSGLCLRPSELRLLLRDRSPPSDSFCVIDEADDTGGVG